MIDLLSFFYSAKMAVVFILMLSLATLEAQNKNDKFYDLMTAINEHFGGEFNEAEKALELDLNDANSFLERLHKFATREIVRKNENGEFECKKSKKPDFKMAIKMILDEDMLNLLKVLRVKSSSNEAYALSTVLGEKLEPNKKVLNFLKTLFAPKKSDQIPSESVDSVKFYSDEKLFNLLFSFATRLEALVHGKNIDGTLKEKEENSKDKIQTFLAVPKCFILPESELSIFDYWIEIIKMKTEESQNPIFGVAIYKEKYDEAKSEDSKENAFELSRESYKILKQLNDQKFSIYESSNLLRATFNEGYSPRSIIPSGKITKIFENLLFQIHWVFYFNWEIYDNYDKNRKCKYAILYQNISESLMEMMSNKMIEPELHLDSQDFKMQEYVQNDVEENCKKFDNKEAKMLFLNNVHYELAINFEFNQRKDIYDRAEVLLSEWVGDAELLRWHEIYPLSEAIYLKKNAIHMLRKIYHFTNNTNRERISIIEALIGKEFNLGSLFDEIKQLVEVAQKEEAKFWKAKKEINSEQLENDIEFLKKNPESIDEEKYQKAVAIICTIKQHGEKVEILAPKIKNIKIQEQLIELSSTIQNYKMNYIGPELWEQTEEACNLLKLKQIKIEKEKTVSDDQFEFYKIWKSIEGGWEGIEEYYLEIPLMQLTEKARTLSKTFGKMLEKVKENYAKKRKHQMMAGM